MRFKIPKLHVGSLVFASNSTGCPMRQKVYYMSNYFLMLLTKGKEPKKIYSRDQLPILAQENWSSILEQAEFNTDLISKGLETLLAVSVPFHNVFLPPSTQNHIIGMATGNVIPWNGWGKTVFFIETFIMTRQFRYWAFRETYWILFDESIGIL